MKLFLVAYANAAILVPALWIGARLWLRRHSRTPAPVLVSAQIIPFPVAMGDLRPKARVRSDGETNGQRLTRSERRRLQKADKYVALRRRSLAKED
jgi:hypothetical protein